MQTADCWVLLTDDFNLYHETIVTTGTTGTIVTEQTLQTGPVFTAFTVCQTATTFTVERKSCQNFTVTFRATFYIIENVIFET